MRTWGISDRGLYFDFLSFLGFFESVCFSLPAAMARVVLLNPSKIRKDYQCNFPQSERRNSCFDEPSDSAQVFSRGGRQLGLALIQAVARAPPPPVWDVTFSSFLFPLPVTPDKSCRLPIVKTSLQARQYSSVRPITSALRAFPSVGSVIPRGRDK